MYHLKGLDDETELLNDIHFFSSIINFYLIIKWLEPLANDIYLNEIF